MSTGNLRLAQWLPRDLPLEGDTVAVTQASPLETEFTTAAFPEAPIDNKQYGRQNEGWTLVPPLPFANDAPSDGNRYGRRNAAWSVIPNPEPDAPGDGTLYGRKNNAWSAVPVDPIPTDAPADGKQYARKTNAWAEIVIPPSGIPEAPINGKQYARQDAAWATIVPANSIVVDDVAPANPKFGDRWVRPANGQDATWVPVTTPAGGGTWVDTDTAMMMLDPVPIANGGTSATTAAAARTNLGIPNHEQVTVDAATGNVSVPGAVNFCGKLGNAFYASYFNNSPLVNFAANAFMQWDIANSKFTFNTPGGRALTVDNMCNVSTLGNVSGASLAASAGLTVGQGANIGNGLTLGGTLTMTNGSIQCKPGSGIAFGPADFYCVQAGGYRQFQYAGNWLWRWNESTGRMAWIANGGESFVIDGANVYIPSYFYVNPAQGVRFNPPGYSGGGPYACTVSQGNPNWGDCNIQFYHDPGLWAGISYGVGTNTNPKWFQMTNSGNFNVPGQVVPGSDSRVKTNRVRVDNALARVALLTGYEYDRIDLTNMDGSPVHAVGLIAQDVEQDGALPAAVSRSKNYQGDLANPATQFDDFRSLDYNGVTALLVNAVNELAQRLEVAKSRIAALEGA